MQNAGALARTANLCASINITTTTQTWQSNAFLTNLFRIPTHCGHSMEWERIWDLIHKNDSSKASEYLALPHKRFGTRYLLLRTHSWQQVQKAMGWGGVNRSSMQLLIRRWNSLDTRSYEVGCMFFFNAIASPYSFAVWIV